MENHAAVNITDDNFNQEIKEFNGVALVDFWAPWCGPCQMMSPRIEELAQEFVNNPQVKIGKCDVDQNEELSSSFQIMSIPNIKIFVKGTVIDEIRGAVQIEAIKSKIEEALAQLDAD